MEANGCFEVPPYGGIKPFFMISPQSQAPPGLALKVIADFPYALFLSFSRSGFSKGHGQHTTGGNFMDVLIRGVDPHAMKKIDEWAKKKKLSRQSYLKELIEKATLLELVSQADHSIEKQLQVNTLFMEKTSDSVNELVDLLKELMVDGE